MNTTDNFLITKVRECAPSSVEPVLYSSTTWTRGRGGAGRVRVVRRWHHAAQDSGSRLAQTAIFSLRLSVSRNSREASALNSRRVCSSSFFSPSDCYYCYLYKPRLRMERGHAFGVRGETFLFVCWELKGERVARAGAVSLCGFE